MCILKYVLNCEQHFSFFVFRSRLTVTGFWWGIQKEVGRDRLAWEDNITMDLREIVCGRYGLDLSGSG
jgi:hypothetical protein